MSNLNEMKTEDIRKIQVGIVDDNRDFCYR